MRISHFLHLKMWDQITFLSVKSWELLTLIFFFFLKSPIWVMFFTLKVWGSFTFFHLLPFTQISWKVSYPPKYILELHYLKKKTHSNPNNILKSVNYPKPDNQAIDLHTLPQLKIDTLTPNSTSFRHQPPVSFLHRGYHFHCEPHHQHQQ